MPLAITNTSDRKLYVTAAVRAIPASGEEDASANGLDVQIVYSDADGKPVDVQRLAQGSDLLAQITIRNTSKRHIDNLALTQMVPAGWEIRNDRLEDVDTEGDRTPGAPPMQRFWWVPNAWRQSLRSAEYTDIRDDRVQRYFSLAPEESIFFETRLNAAYLGRFYLPGTRHRSHVRRQAARARQRPLGRSDAGGQMKIAAAPLQRWRRRWRRIASAAPASHGRCPAVHLRRRG